VNWVDPWGLRGRPKFEIWHFPDSFYDDNSWLNDPNNPLAQSTDHGEIMGWSTCVAEHMARQYHLLSAATMAESATVTGLSIMSGTTGTILVTTIEAGSNAGAINEFRKALQKSIKECECNGN